MVNSAGTTVFTPSTHVETQKYMDELIDFMDGNDALHPLIKAAIIHSSNPYTRFRMAMAVWEEFS